MAVNENVNKVVCNGSTLIDLTEDTVEASMLVSGYTAHDASGAPITGTLELSHTEEYEGTAVVLPAGATFDKLEILGNTVNGESVKGRNLVDVSTNTSGYYISASGAITSDKSFSVYTDLIPVVPGGTYTIQGHSGRANNKRLHAYGQDGSWVRQVLLFTATTAPVGSDYSDTFTLGSDVYFLRFSYAGEDTDVQISSGSSVSPYMPYRAIGVKVANALGMVKTTVPIGLGTEVLESYQDSADVLTVTAGGTAQITKNGSDPSIIALEPVEWPVVEGGDIFSLEANLSTTLVLTCTVGAATTDATLVSKQITANGTYNASDDSADGYSDVTVNVPTTAADLGSKAISANGTYEADDDSLDGYSSVTVNVPNSYAASDEGKVVSSGSLVAQTSTTKTANGTYDTTLNDEVTVNVPNSYAASDEGKVVSSGGLVSQTSTTKIANGTYDTTLNDEVTVNVAPNVGTKTVVQNGVYNASSDSLDGYSSVTVDVPASAQADLDSKTITENGVYDASTDSLDGYSSVTVNVAPNVDAKTVTENGTYDASTDSLDGYSRVVVSVTPESNPYDDYANKTLRVIPSDNGAVTSLRASVFYSFYGLESVNFSNCSTIQDSAFTYCYGLKTVSLPSCTSIRSYAFQACHALRSAYFPACTYVGLSAFAGCSALSVVEFPELSEVQAAAFEMCTSLERISFPKLTNAYNAFGSCWTLSEVYLPELKSTQQGTFSHCYNLERVNLPKISSIGRSCFSSCIALREVSAPLCTFVGSDAFNRCGFSEITLPECSTVSDYAFRSCQALSKVSLPKCTVVGYGTFSGCTALSELSLPACLSTGDYAFYSCQALSKVSLPECTVVGYGTFADCTALSELSLPACLSIGRDAFSGCKSLSALYLMGESYVSISTSTFSASPFSAGGTGTVYVPSSMYQTYLTLPVWSTLSSRLSGI